MTLGLAPSMTATQELVVPRSMPITFALVQSFRSGNRVLVSRRSVLRSVYMKLRRLRRERPTAMGGIWERGIGAARQREHAFASEFTRRRGTGERVRARSLRHTE